MANKLDIQKGEYYFRESRSTYNEYTNKYSYLVFECIGHNTKGIPMTENIAGFYNKEDAKKFCELKNAERMARWQ